tara:strand:- start:519 stop:1154 length:636 start_codon:yes stop_codon:yes gene_type:complete
MSVRFYYRPKNGNQTLGPFTVSELRREAASGKLKPDDAVEMEGTNENYKAKLIKGLFDSVDSPQATATKPPAINISPARDTTLETPTANVSPTPEASTTPSRGNNTIHSRSHKDQTLAIISLITGILSLTFGCCSWWVLIPTTLAAIVTGLLVTQKFWKGQGEGKGIYGIALAGFILGIATVLLHVVLNLYFWYMLKDFEFHSIPQGNGFF